MPVSDQGEAASNDCWRPRTQRRPARSLRLLGRADGVSSKCPAASRLSEQDGTEQWRRTTLWDRDAVGDESRGTGDCPSTLNAAHEPQAGRCSAGAACSRSIQGGNVACTPPAEEVSAMQATPDEPSRYQSTRAMRSALMRVGTGLAVAALTVLATSGLADDTTGKRGATAERTFLQSASNGSLAEVELGKLAEQRAS